MTNTDCTKAHVNRLYLLSVVSMNLHQLADIKLGCSQNLDLPDKHALQWVDSAALLLNVLACTQVCSLIRNTHFLALKF